MSPRTLTTHRHRLGGTLALLSLLLLLYVAVASASGLQTTIITADNSVVLANALGYKRSFDAVGTSPICLIKIKNVEQEDRGDGMSYVYNILGCPTQEFRGFGVCTSAACAVHPYQVEVFVPTGSAVAQLQQIQTMH